MREAPICTHSDAMLLVNAVKGTCALPAPYGRAFPPEVRRNIDLLFSTLTKRFPQIHGAAFDRIRHPRRYRDG
jgi:hypothetical protein